MRIWPIVLLLVTMLGYGSAESGGNQAQPQKVATTDEKTPAVAPKPIRVVPNSPKAKAAIETAIRQAAGKPTGELTKADLEKVTRLDLSFNQITDLKSLARLTKLRTLDLTFNPITDLKPLAGLTKLRTLNFNFNQITDLKPLAGLTKLVVLSLFANQITDLKPLTGLTELKGLRLDRNPNLTKAEIDKLQQVLPKCNIEHNATK